MTADTCVDACVLIDVSTDDPRWGDWSANALARAGQGGRLMIDGVIHTEVSTAFARIEDVNDLLPETAFHREPIPWEAAFPAGKAFQAYRRRGGVHTHPLPDVFIGAHAAVRSYDLLTRDTARFWTYVPTLNVIAPEGRRIATRRQGKARAILQV